MVRPLSRSVAAQPIPFHTVWYSSKQVLGILLTLTSHLMSHPAGWLNVSLFYNAYPLHEDVFNMLNKTGYANYTIQFHSNRAAVFQSNVFHLWPDARGERIHQEATESDISVRSNVQKM